MDPISSARHRANVDRFENMSSKREELRRAELETRPGMWSYADGRARWLTQWPTDQVLQSTRDGFYENRTLRTFGPFDTVYDSLDPAMNTYVTDLRLWAQSLTPEQRSAIQWWSNGGDALIQNIARARDARNAVKRSDVTPHLTDQPWVTTLAKFINGPRFKFESPEGLALAEEILHNTLLTAPRTPVATLLWRGMRLSWNEADTIAANSKVFVSRSPQSWTRDPSVAASFQNSNVMLGLLVPEGTRLADRSLQDPTEKYPFITIGSFPREWEVIIPRGTRMRVIAAYAPSNDFKATIRWIRFLPTQIIKSTDGFSPIIFLELLRSGAAHPPRGSVAIGDILDRPSAEAYVQSDQPLGLRSISSSIHHRRRRHSSVSKNKRSQSST